MNSGLHLVSAHSVVALAENLAARIAARPDPFAMETVLVMNFAQGVWLRRFLAERLGICANIDFRSPESFLERLVRRGRGNAFDRETLAWRIFSKLKEFCAPGAGTPDAMKFGLAGRDDDEIFRRAAELGDLFWRYQSFRPEMIRDWCENAPAPSGVSPDFLAEYCRQKNLWRALDFGGEKPPAVAWLEMLANPAPLAGMPARIFVFAPSALPRIHFELLEKLSAETEVVLCYHNLSAFLWTDSKEQKKILRERLRAKKSGKKTSVENADFSEEGNELLAAWGKAAKPLAARLIDSGALDHESNLDAPPERDSLLHALQRSIRDDVPARECRFEPASGDDSLKILVAPSPLREMEILRDELLARFADDSSLRPRDVLVTLADFDTYAPFVRAAFENSGIPFSVADRAGTEIFPCAAAFLEILQVARGELRLDEVLSLLDPESVRSGLGLSDDEVFALRRVLNEAGVRWGSDEEFRRRRIFGENVPAIAEAMRVPAETLAANNSWRFGMRRLALGYFFDVEEDGATFDFGDRLRAAPFPALREEAPSALGKFSRLLDVLEKLANAFSEKEIRSVPEWCDFLAETLADGIFSGVENGANVLRSALAGTAAAAKNVGGGDESRVPACTLAAFCVALERLDWSAGRTSGGMLRGKVTFCRMQPLRNIPARVVAVCGLSSGAFPRTGTKNALDLLSFSAKNFPDGSALWDRSSRDDDCLLFLENILAAKDSLMLSYVGRNAVDGKALPPSVPLSKLRDFLGELTGEISPSDEKSDAVGAPEFETLHHLHGFAPDYFSGKNPKLFSFSRADYLTAKTAQAAATAKPVPAGTPERRRIPFAFPKTLSVRELADFFKSPATFVCKFGLGAANEFSGEKMPTDDPRNGVSALEICRLHKFIFEKKLAESQGERNSPAENFEDAERRFYAAELDAGRAPAMSQEAERCKDFEKKIADKDALSQVFSGKFLPLRDGEVPAALNVKCGGNAGTTLRLQTDFANLRRDESGALFLPLVGKRKLDWRVAVETFVAAAALVEAFPRERFLVEYFLPDEKMPAAITSETFPRAKMSIHDLVEFFAKTVSTPPLFFTQLPVYSKEKDLEKIENDPEIFVDAASKAWAGISHDAGEIFVFGENAETTLEGNLRDVVFPFAYKIYSAFVPAPH